jgi:deoxyribonuclease V
VVEVPMTLMLHHAHPWQLTPQQAEELQNNLRGLVNHEPLPGAVQRIGGLDVGFAGDAARAAVAVLAYPSLQPLELAVVETTVRFPYIPGLLSFRELPALLAALEQLSDLPDVLLADGHGVAHPRRFGLASHLGVLLDRPSIGCAKSVLVGSYERLADAAGSTAELRDKDEVIGVALRSRSGSRPLIVSIGHRVDLPAAVQLVLACTRGHRLPEPARLAHHLTTRPPDEQSYLKPLCGSR